MKRILISTVSAISLLVLVGCNDDAEKTAAETGNAVKEGASSITEKLKEKASEAMEATKDAASGVVDSAKDMASRQVSGQNFWQSASYRLAFLVAGKKFTNRRLAKKRKKITGVSHQAAVCVEVKHNN